MNFFLAADLPKASQTTLAVGADVPHTKKRPEGIPCRAAR